MNDQTNGPADDAAEQVFFADPALDRAFGVVMALATEVQVLRDRVAALERVLERGGMLDRAALDAEPAAGEVAAAKDEREAFVRHLLTPLLGRQASKGMPR